MYTYSVKKKGMVTVNRVWGRVWRTAVALAAAGALTAGACRVPLSTWAVWGERAAQIAMGLSRPQESLSYMQQLVETEETASPMISDAVDASVRTEEPSPIPVRGEGGDVKEVVLRSQMANGVSVKNNSGVAYDIEALLAEGSPLTLSDTREPQVLIVHTHGCECYMSYYAGYYNDTDPVRSENGTENVTAVGEAIAQELRAAGIGVIHNTTLHDSPTYTGAYNRSEQTIQSVLERYPSIRMVLDIHRDAMMQEDGTKLKPTVTVNGRKAAQVMAVIGGTDIAERPNPHCKENLRLALQFHKAMETAYPSIMRPVLIADARYNQGLLAGSMLIEVGTDANTLSESIYSGHLLGKQLAFLMR